MAQPDYSKRNENQYMWWVETPGTLNLNAHHGPGLSIAYQSIRDGALYSPTGTESFQVQYIKQAEVIDSVGSCVCLGKFTINASLDYGAQESELPIQFHSALVDYAVARGYERKPEGLNQAKYFNDSYLLKVRDGIAFASNARVKANSKAVVNPTTGLR